MNCYFPKTIKNPKFRYADIAPGEPKPYNYYITIGCGYCPECLKRKGNDWKVRLLHEVRSVLSQRKVDSNGFVIQGHCEFVTLTFNDDVYKDFVDDSGRALRLFLERYRKRFGKSVRHWFISELGGDNGRLHLHGILFDAEFRVKPHTFDHQYDPLTKKYHFTSNDGLIKEYVKDLKSLWSYGNVWVGFCDEQCVGYIVKYMTKHNADDGNEFMCDFHQRVYASRGIGSSYVTDISRALHILRGGRTIVRSIVVNGFRYAMPRYIQLKMFGEKLLRLHSLLSFLDPPPESLYFNGTTFDSLDSKLSAIRQRAAEYLKKPFANHKSVLKHYSSELHSHSFCFEDFVAVYEYYGRKYAQAFYDRYIKPFTNLYLKNEIYGCYSIA